MAPDTESLRGEKMLVGYARVSTAEQNLDLQIDALEKAGCEKIFTEKMSSVKDRPVFKQTLDFIRSGDTLIIWKLDRIGRSLIDLVHIVNHLRERGISLQIITERFDTSTPEGEMLFHFYAMLAQYERSKIQERTRAGLTAARARGRKGGGKFKLTGVKLEAAMRAMENPQTVVKDLAEANDVSTPTLYRAYKRWNDAKEPVKER
jgi:DNA invertase Pin-like site-specific DNA recombinase